MSRFNFAHQSTQWLVLMLLALTWGSSFILMKRGLVYFDSDQVATFRITVAWLVLLPIALRHLNQIRANWKPLLVIGLLGNTLPAFLFAHAQTEIPSAVSGILNSLTSLFTLLIGVFLFRTKTTWMQVTGVFLALIGAAGLIGFDNLAALGPESDMDARYALLIVLSTSMYGIAVNTIKAKLQHMRPTHISALAFMLVGPWCMAYLFLGTDFTSTLIEQPESWIGVFYLSILAILGTAMAVVIFNQLIMETTAVFATTVVYLIPIVALGWGLIDGESITVFDVLYMLLILAGIFLVNMKRPGPWINRLLQ